MQGSEGGSYPPRTDKPPKLEGYINSRKENTGIQCTVPNLMERVVKEGKLMAFSVALNKSLFLPGLQFSHL